MKKDRTRNIPIWVTIPVLLLFLSGGAWLCYWYYHRDDEAPEIIGIDQRLADGTDRAAWNMRSRRGPDTRRAPDTRRTPTTPGTPGTFFPTRRPTDTPAPRLPGGDGIQHSDRSMLVRAGMGTVILPAPTNLQGYEPRPGYTPTAGVLAKEQQDLFIVGTTMVMDQSAREKFGVSDEQRKQLRALGSRENMTGVTAEEQKQIVELLKEYQAAGSDRAKSAAAEKKVVDALAEVGKKHLEQTKASYAARAQKIQEILTPELIERYKAGTPAGPASKPAAPKPAPAVAPAPTTSPAK